MTLLRLSPLALSRSRFALSPLAETVGSVLTLAKPAEDAWLTRWRDQHRPQFLAALGEDPFAAGLVDLMASTTWLPDLIAIPPRGGMATALADELAEVAATPDDEVRRCLDPAVEQGWTRTGLAWLTGHGWGARIAEFLRSVWDRHVAADWPRRRAMLERDVLYRAGLLATHGWPRALEQLNRRSAWVGDDAIRISFRPGPDRTVGADGVQFVPVSHGRGSWLCEQPPNRYALVYPIRGAATAVDEPEPVSGALDRLIGAGRATVLRALQRPATSTQLATELRLSLGTVGGHLAVLREARLISGTRVGRRVVYRRTDIAETLLAGSDVTYITS
ncbi:ArsR family transcriptional regulator [Actinoplanes sp. N902-109]|uniref:ArsR family transcriptional regulator n=1 Tax=Actinoplanes sp. (strain N902-109) TaxID=649831 RepID=UPI0003294AAD|nr:ArsR family transcriptional regulator [Actinoplanes sp. N902-109]AGL19004.1 putative transcriptional regulator [Actinoplanes sp. N902-109]